MKICLLCPKYTFEGYAPTGLASLAAVAEGLGHTVQIVDLNVQPLSDVEDDVDLFGVTGLSLWQNNIINLVNRLGKPCIIGGNWATQKPEQIIEICKREHKLNLRDVYRFYSKSDIIRKSLLHPDRALKKLVKML